MLTFVFLLGIGLAGMGVYLMRYAQGMEAETGPVLAFMGAVFALITLGVHRFNVVARRWAEAERRLFESGRRAVAVVEGVDPTGLNVNDDRQIVLQLRVQPPGEPEFTCRRKVFVPFYGIPRAGDLIDVAYDPADRTKVALAADWNRGGEVGRLLVLRRPGGTEGTAVARSDYVIDQLERLERLRQSGTLSFAEFEAQKARILSGGA